MTNSELDNDEILAKHPPLLRSIIERGMGKRMSKKMRFEKENTQQYHDDIEQQVIDKNVKSINDRMDNIMLERELLKQNRQMMVC